MSLGDLVAKMGDSVLQEIVPILQDTLQSDDVTTRRGVCFGLGEVIKAGKKAVIGAYMNELIPAVRDALCDELECVRAVAGLVLRTLHRNVGRKAIDEIVPIREILKIASKEVLPYLVPQLVQTPMTLFHAKLLASLSNELGQGFHRYVADVSQALLDGMSGEDDHHSHQPYTNLVAQFGPPSGDI